MSLSVQTDPNFVFKPNPPIVTAGNYPTPHLGPPPPPVPQPMPSTPPSPLDQLIGTWRGTGFNTIWRPHFPNPPQDRLLELNLTDETLIFTRINGPIPNRGLLQQDINMFGLTYIQQISDSSNGSGLHIEPGIWAVVPQTTGPMEPPSVVRMASIPHGTVILTQGTASPVSGPLVIPDNNIIPFALGATPPLNSQFSQGMLEFTELNLEAPSAFRLAPLGVTQAMVENPNSVLQSALIGRTIRNATALEVSTNDTPVPGGGTANTAFLEAGNANATQVVATFWIETIENPPGPDTLQLQYSQTVMLDFNGLHWPHVTVATLTKVIPAP